jgi:membrane protein DedA with SNARE-associated domain
MEKRPILFVLLGSLLSLTGVVFIAMYLWEAVIVRLGESDQSLLFWYLPILFIGLISLRSGVRLMRKDKP